ncbi:hypothetical protein M758_UG054800 [Ceratodon purpureus]|nr:hypothetical protein M758_UG054800 [Ceratodon purpureus]
MFPTSTMRVFDYKLRRYKTIVENEALLRKKTGVENSFFFCSVTVFRYAAHNANLQEDARKALVGGDITTPSVGSPETSEGEDNDEQVPPQSTRAKASKLSSMDEDTEDNSIDCNNGSSASNKEEYLTNVTTTSGGRSCRLEDGSSRSEETACRSDLSDVRNKERKMRKDEKHCAYGGRTQSTSTASDSTDVTLLMFNEEGNGPKRRSCKP